jgi:hypothetical protein
MIVEQQSLVSFAFALCKDHRGTISVHDFSGEAARTEHLGNQVGAFLQANALGTNAWLRYKFGKFSDTLIEILFEIRIELGMVRHEVLLI